VLLTAFSHIQGIGIAILGLTAVATWRLIAWKRSAGWVLPATVILLSLATVRWYHRHPAIDQMYRSQGYLNAWHGFNIFSLSSPAGDRMLQIIGSVGLVNLAAGLLLLRHNHLVAWLTIMPLIALCLPCVAIPFAGLLAQHDNPINIIIFQRMLFAIPAGLALVCFGARMIACRAEKSPGPSRRPFFAFNVAMGSLVILTTVSPGRPHYNHFWDALVQTPADLQVSCLMADLKSPYFVLDAKNSPILLATRAISAILRSAGVETTPFSNRLIGTPIADSANHVIASIADPQNRASLLCIPPARSLYTSASLAGQLSGHWPSQQVALDYAAGPELEAAALKAGGVKLQESGTTFYRLAKIPVGK
jgi:hypothetical protein